MDLTGPAVIKVRERAYYDWRAHTTIGNGAEHEAFCAGWDAAAPHLAAAERAAEQSRLWVAIRHGIPLDRPWRGEALDLIEAVFRQEAAGD